MEISEFHSSLTSGLNRSWNSEHAQEPHEVQNHATSTRQLVLDKPIIATTLSGLFVKHEPWDKAHVLWYKKAAEKLKDASVNKWANRSDYFKGVDEVMKRIYPDLSDEERTIKARETFFNSVCDYVKKYPRVKNNSIIKYFDSLKKSYRLALITTNIKSALKKIIEIAGLTDFFDIIEASMPDEKDDKRIGFERFIKKYGKPLIYIGGERKDSFDYCKEKGIPCIFANFEKQPDIEGIESVRNLEELKQKLSKL